MSIIALVHMVNIYRSDNNWSSDSMNLSITCVFLHVRNRHQCAECPKNFVWNQSLLRHHREQHEGVSYPCTFCSKKFTRSDVRKKHQETCHGNATSIMASVQSEWVLLTSEHGSDDGNEYEDLKESDAEDQKSNFNPSPIAAIAEEKMSRRSEKRDVKMASVDQTDGIQVKQYAEVSLKFAMFCSKCGTKFIFADDQFCTICGARRQVLK